MRATATALSFEDDLPLSSPISSRTQERLTAQSASDFADESAFGDEGPPTKRIRPLQLAAALKQVADDFEANERMQSSSGIVATEPQPFDLADDDDACESTVTVSPEENRRLLATAFRIVDQQDLQATLDAIDAIDAPTMPPPAPEPAQDFEFNIVPPAPESQPDIIRELYPVLVPTEATNNVVPQSGKTSSSRPGSGGYTKFELELDQSRNPISGLRFRLTPEMKQSILAVRADARTNREEDRRTYILVGAIWLLAISSIASLVYFMMSNT